MAVNDVDFLFISDLIYDRLGIRLEKEKGYLIEARLAKVAEKAGLKTLGDLVNHLRTGRPREEIITETVEAMTTNETYFFRDIAPFDALREKVLPEVIARKRHEKVINIWSAACSTGQEAYSIALTLREAFPHLADWQVRITGTDVAGKVVNRAKEGIFTRTEMGRGITPVMLAKYFMRQGEDWKIKDDVRKMIHFSTLNLKREWPHMPRMDVIFLRNVLIYMDNPSRKTIFGRAHRLLQPGGYLFLGAAETTFNISDLFERLDWKQAGCFRPV